MNAVWVFYLFGKRGDVGDERDDYITAVRGTEVPLPPSLLLPVRRDVLQLVPRLISQVTHRPTSDRLTLPALIFLQVCHPAFSLLISR